MEEQLREFWIKYELEGGMKDCEGPYLSELAANTVAISFLAHVPEAAAVTTYLVIFYKKRNTPEIIRLLTRQQQQLSQPKQAARRT